MVLEICHPNRGTGQQQEVSMKIVRILSLIVLLAATLFVGYQIYLYLGRGDLTITATPYESTITIDKTTYTNTTAKNIPVAPGEHSVTVRAPGYRTLQQTIAIGWQESVSKKYILKTKPLKEIYAEADGATSLEGYDVVQEQFFLKNTWVAGYVVPANEDEGDISVIIMNRKNGVWQIVLHSDNLPDDASQQLPAPVYEYLKDFGGNGE